MHKVSNFLGWENVLGSIEQGTLIAINKSIGFYHGHLMIRGNKLRIENDPDIFLMNPIENFGIFEVAKLCEALSSLPDGVLL